MMMRNLLVTASRLAGSSAARPVARHAARAARLPQLKSTPVFNRFASSSSQASVIDPSEKAALQHLESGNRALEDGDVASARDAYKRSVEVQRTATALHNLGVAEYHLKNTASAIECWKGALELQPSADCHTNLASAYILSQPPQPALAIRHLKDALSMTPDDPEIAYNLAACLESTGALEPALKLYERSKAGGIDRAEQNIRNIKAKLLGAKAEASP